MLKSESILKLEIAGMNTLNYFITEDPKEITHYLAKHLDEPLSLRTERGKQFKCPFYYQVKGKDLLQKALQYLSEGYKLIIAPSLDTVGCIAFGTVMLGDKWEHDVMEFVMGEGKVRELDSHPQLETLILHQHIRDLSKLEAYKDWDPKKIQILNSIRLGVKNYCYEYAPCVVEWSYYNRPVGRKNENAVYWEIR